MVDRLRPARRLREDARRARGRRRPAGAPPRLQQPARGQAHRHRSCRTGGQFPAGLRALLGLVRDRAARDEADRRCARDRDARGGGRVRARRHRPRHRRHAHADVERRLLAAFQAGSQARSDRHRGAHGRRARCHAPHRCARDLDRRPRQGPDAPPGIQGAGPEARPGDRPRDRGRRGAEVGPACRRPRGCDRRRGSARLGRPGRARAGRCRQEPRVHHRARRRAAGAQGHARVRLRWRGERRPHRHRAVRRAGGAHRGILHDRPLWPARVRRPRGRARVGGEHLQPADALADGHRRRVVEEPVRPPHDRRLRRPDGAPGPRLVPRLPRRDQREPRRAQPAARPAARWGASAVLCRRDCARAARSRNA